MPQNSIRFIKFDQKRNIINNYELLNLLKDLSNSYPEFKDYIESNIRNYLIKFFPCVQIDESSSHNIYTKFFKLKLEAKNPEVLLSKKNGNFDFHQLIISRVVLKPIQDMLDYLRINQIIPKSQNNIIHLLRDSEIWHKNNQDLKNIEEGLIEVIIDGTKFKWVLLKDFQAFKRESILMKNCVKNYYTNFSLNKCLIYSLRDEKNKPLVTAEIRNNYLIQVKSSSNTCPEPYKEEISLFLEKMNYSKASFIQDHEIPTFYTMGGVAPYNPYGVDEDLSFWDKTKKFALNVFLFFFFKI